MACNAKGLLSSVIAVVEKTSFALGAAFIGILLSRSGYVPTRNGQIIPQPRQAVDALYVSFVLVPVILGFGNIAFIRQYTLGGRVMSRR